MNVNRFLKIKDLFLMHFDSIFDILSKTIKNLKISENLSLHHKAIP